MAQDVEGWRKLQEGLGNKCLVVADRALASGLHVIPTPRPRQHPSSSEVGKEEPLFEGSEGTPEGLKFLSCASFTLETTLSATFSKSLTLAGPLICVHCIVHVARVSPAYNADKVPVADCVH